MSQTLRRPKVINGLDVDRLFGEVEALQDEPGRGRLRFRASNRWLAGGHSRTAVEALDPAGPAPRAPSVLEADLPPSFLGGGRAASPLEHLLHALASSLAAGFAYHAAARGIHVREVACRVEGELDLRGFTGIDDTAGPGFQGVRARFQVAADAPPGQLEALLRLSAARSPVLDVFRRPIAVTVTLAEDGADLGVSPT